MRRVQIRITETVGMGLPNIEATPTIPVPPEVAERWASEAASEGISLEEYVARLFEAPDDASDKD